MGVGEMGVGKTGVGKKGSKKFTHLITIMTNICLVLFK